MRASIEWQVHQSVNATHVYLLHTYGIAAETTTKTREREISLGLSDAVSIGIVVVCTTYTCVCVSTFGVSVLDGCGLLRHKVIKARRGVSEDGGSHLLLRYTY